jgi:hypothetical protein
VNKQIEAVENELKKPELSVGDVAYFRDKGKQLRDEKKELRDKEKQLRDKEKQLLARKDWLKTASGARPPSRHDIVPTTRHRA